MTADHGSLSLGAIGFIPERPHDIIRCTFSWQGGARQAQITLGLEVVMERIVVVGAGLRRVTGRAGASGSTGSA